MDQEVTAGLNAGEPNAADLDTELASVLAELLELRRTVARCLGREQYLYQVLDQAIESQHPPTMERALHEFNRQGRELVRDLQAAGE